MPRVNEVAKELGLSSREVMDHLEKIGHPVSSHSAAIDDDTAERVRAEANNGEVGPEAGGSRSTAVLQAERPAADPAAADGGTGTTSRAPVTAVPKKKRKKVLGHLAEIPVLILIAFGVAILIKTFLVQAFYIPSGSMIPTLRNGDRVLVEKVTYVFGDPKRGDVVVFAKSVFGNPPDVPWHQDAQNFFRELLGLPSGVEQDYIKRVVGVGGDRIRYAGNPRVLTVNGEPVDEPYVNKPPDVSSPTLTNDDCRRLEMEPADDGCRVPAGRVFVMGDNRGDSQDSRVLGPVEEDKIVGKAFVIIWPFDDAGGL